MNLLQRRTLQTAANSVAIFVIRKRRGRGLLLPLGLRAVCDQVEHGGMLPALPEKSTARRSGSTGPLLFTALGHVARDGNSASGRAAGFSRDEGEGHFDIEPAPGLVRRTG